MSTRIVSQKGMLLKYMMVHNTDRPLHAYILSACMAGAVWQFKLWAYKATPNRISMMQATDHLFLQSFMRCDRLIIITLIE